MIAASPVSAATVDFNANLDDRYFVSQVLSNGFIATGNVFQDGVTLLGTNDSVDDEGPSNGTVHLDSWTNMSANSVWTLTKADGAAFGLSAFDFATFTYELGTAASVLTLTGITAANLGVVQTFTPTAGNFQTFTLSPAFANVTSVTFDAFGDRNRAAYDNIVVNAASAVPEPATWAMMFLGFGSVGAAARYRRRVSAAARA